MRKSIILSILVLIAVLGLAAYFLIYKNQPMAQAINSDGKELLAVDFPLKDGHQLYLEYNTSLAPTGKLFDLDMASGNITQIENATELSRIIGPIETKEQALALARFFTSDPTRFLLKQNPMEGIEPSDESRRGITTVRLDNDGWVIERNLLLYPKPPTPAQLVRTYETISKVGDYRFNIGQVLAAGDEINNLLPYYE